MHQVVACLALLMATMQVLAQEHDAILERLTVNADAGYPQSHASTIAQAADGHLVAAAHPARGD